MSQRKQIRGGGSSGIWLLISDDAEDEEERLTMRGRELRVSASMIDDLKSYKELPDWAASYVGMTFENRKTKQRILFTDKRIIQL